MQGRRGDERATNLIQWPDGTSDLGRPADADQTDCELAGCELNRRPEFDGVRYKSTWTKSHSSRWKPSIHMPRWASRITLEITGVRVERLQEISEKDAKAEGVDTMRDMRFAAAFGNLHSGACRLNFIDLWQSINGPESWSANPWVWVIEFRRVV